MAYLLDSDVFIQAKNLHYGFDFCPAFWDWIDQQAAAGEVLSIEKVKDELVGGAAMTSRHGHSSAVISSSSRPMLMCSRACAR